MINGLKLGHIILPLFLAVSYIYFILLMVKNYIKLEQIPLLEYYLNRNIFNTVIDIFFENLWIIAPSGCKTQKYKPIQKC